MNNTFEPGLDRCPGETQELTSYPLYMLTSLEFKGWQSL